MRSLFLRLKRFWKRDVTVVIMDNHDPDVTDTFRPGSRELVSVVAAVILGAVVVTTLLFYLTPLGSLYVRSSGSEFRQEVMQITERVIALQDSLERRERQLADIRDILVQVPDTVFETRSRPLSNQEEMPVIDEVQPSAMTVSSTVLNREELEALNRTLSLPVFPVSQPVQGSVSQPFNRQERHFGIDISAPEGAEFHAIADGVVVFAGWTTSYGYVVYLQHREGYLSIYKHATTLFRQVGETVVRGEVLGRIGDRGALSFGSHLHFELWKDGIVLQPNHLLMEGISHVFQTR